MPLLRPRRREWRILSLKVRAEAAACAACGAKTLLNVHHRNGDETDDSAGNLVVLCARCHGLAHAGQVKYGWDYLDNQLSLFD